MNWQTSLQEKRISIVDFLLFAVVISAAYALVAAALRSDGGIPVLVTVVGAYAFGTMVYFARVALGRLTGSVTEHPTKYTGKYAHMLCGTLCAALVALALLLPLMLMW